MTIQRICWVALQVIPLLHHTLLKNMLSPSQDVHIWLQLNLILPFLARLNISGILYFHPVNVSSRLLTNFWITEEGRCVLVFSNL